MWLEKMFLGTFEDVKTANGTCSGINIKDSAQGKSKDFFEYIGLPINWNASTAVWTLCTRHLTIDFDTTQT